MMRASEAKVEWNADKKQWHVRVQIGEEVIKRPLAKTPREASEDDLRSRAIQVAKDEGYDVDAAQVAIQR